MRPTPFERNLVLITCCLTRSEIYFDFPIDIRWRDIEPLTAGSTPLIWRPGEGQDLFRLWFATVYGHVVMEKPVLIWKTAV